MTRLLLLDDHASFRQAMAIALRLEEGVEIAAEACTLEEARTRLGGIDLALVDLDLPDGSGEEIIPDLRRESPDADVVILSGTTDRARLARAIEAGAIGVVSKTAGVEEVAAAVHKVRAGEPLLGARELFDLVQLARADREARAEAEELRERLTPRELEVLQALADGLGNKQIAQRLNISLETQRTHMANIIGKLGASSQLQALVIAIRHGLVEVR